MIFADKQQTLDLVKGNKHAADFIELIVTILHFWDDLIDKDKALSDTEINAHMFNVLVTLPRNPFYAANFSALNVILTNSITNWQVANRLEREGDEYEKHIAYILRSSYVDLITHAGLLVGGPEWAQYVGHKIRCHAHAEGYEGYLSNLEAEQSARAAKENR